MNKKTMIYLLLLTLLIMGALSAIFLPDNKFRLYFTSGCLLIIVILIHIFSPLIANKESSDYQIGAMRCINIIVGIIIVAEFLIQNFIPSNLFDHEDKWAFELILAIVIIIGNLAPLLPMNGAIGVRLPWTTSNAETWHATHLMLKWISWPIAILIIINGIVLDEALAAVVGLAIWCIIPCIYSYIYYKKRWLH